MFDASFLQGRPWIQGRQVSLMCAANPVFKAAPWRIMHLKWKAPLPVARVTATPTFCWVPQPQRPGASAKHRAFSLLLRWLYNYWRFGKKYMLIFALFVKMWKHEKKKKRRGTQCNLEPSECFYSFVKEG